VVAGIYRHEIKQGEAYSVDVDLRDERRNDLIDTSGWVGASSIQTLDAAAPLDSNGVAIAFSVTFPTTGTMRMTLPASRTVQLPAKRYLYDVKLTDTSGLPAYYLEGDVIVRRSYTP
jgi:hypothetical protein